jgi:hypothetical protein
MTVPGLNASVLASARGGGWFDEGNYMKTLSTTDAWLFVVLVILLGLLGAMADGSSK